LDLFQSEIVGLLPRLRRLARALTRDAADADDLVQLTVERAMTRAGQWEPGSRLDSWTFRIMKNAWIDETRARRRRGEVFDLDADGLAAATDGAAAMQARMEALAAEAAMAELPADQRIAVALVLVEGLSYREAADVLEIPEGTLTSRLVRGRNALIARLVQEGPTDDR
jgi:RNA polymerase sigma factor (sigma-70 family)